MYQFFNTMLELGIFDLDNVVFEPYDDLGYQIIELYKNGKYWKEEL